MHRRQSPFTALHASHPLDPASLCTFAEQHTDPLRLEMHRLPQFLRVLEHTSPGATLGYNTHSPSPVRYAVGSQAEQPLLAGPVSKNGEDGSQAVHRAGGPGQQNLPRAEPLAHQALGREVEC